MNEIQKIIDDAVIIVDNGFCSQGNSSFEELDSLWLQLRSKFQNLNLDRAPGFPVYPGWWFPLAVAFENLENLFANSEAKFVLLQLKEKFGGIRFYYRVDNGNEELFNKCRAIVENLERACEHRCEICGDVGKASHAGWIQTLCEKHEKARNARNKKLYGD